MSHDVDTPHHPRVVPRRPAPARQCGTCFGAALTWNRRYHRTDIDAQVKEATGAVSHPGFLLTEPWEVRTGSGTPYRVFTPFSKKAQGMLLDAPPFPHTRPCR